MEKHDSEKEDDGNEKDDSVMMTTSDTLYPDAEDAAPLGYTDMDAVD
jgi:hypothetical protein